MTTEEFFEPSFDAGDYARQVVESGESVNHHLAKLANDMNELDKQLKTQITAHHGKLLSQATSIESVEGVLDMLRQHVGTLQLSSERVCGRIVELYDKAEMRTNQLERLHTTCNLLRAAIRIMSLSSKLKNICGLISDPTAAPVISWKEAPRVAAMLQEMREITDELNLSGLTFLNDDLALIPRLSKDLMTEVRNLLRQGLKAPNHGNVVVALQALHNMKVMSRQLERLYDDWLEEVEKSIDTLSWAGKFEAAAKKRASPALGSGPGSADLPSKPSSAEIRATLWSGVTTVCSNLKNIATQCDVLVTVLMRKKDPVTQKPFADPAILETLVQFWGRLSERTAYRWRIVAQNVTYLLESEYPKLLMQFVEVEKRMEKLDSLPKLLEKDADSIGTLRNSISNFENAYLSKSVSRLFDVVNLAFSEDQAPSNQEIANLVQVISNELQVAAFDEILFGRGAKNVAKTVDLFGVKCEALLVTDGEASQVIGNVSPAQRKNTAVVNALYLFRSETIQSLSRFEHFSSATLDSLMKSFDGLLNLMSGAITPLLESTLEAISAIIASMHQEHFGFEQEAGQAERQCSLYMRELQGFISRVCEEYFAPFSCKHFIYEHTTELARKVCDMFVLNAVLVRPLAEGGRLRLAADFAQMELALSPLCQKITDIGRSYELLRAVRPLLFEDPAVIAKADQIGRIIPVSVVLHLLISLSPPELQSPHTTAGWSINRYSEWLQKHTNEKDRLHFLKGTLDAYTKQVEVSGSKEYVRNYPRMVDLMQKGRATLQ